MPRPGGRPSYKPTDEERTLVRNMAAAGLAQQTIQLCLPNAPKSHKTFTKVFRPELVQSQHLVTAKAISKLVVALNNGEAWAICFWLKCRANFRETERREIVGDPAQPLEVRVQYEDKAIPD